eukprot:g18041.t1
MTGRTPSNKYTANNMVDADEISKRLTSAHSSKLLQRIFRNILKESTKVKSKLHIRRAQSRLRRRAYQSGLVAAHAAQQATLSTMGLFPTDQSACQQEGCSGKLVRKESDTHILLRPLICDKCGKRGRYESGQEALSEAEIAALDPKW